MYNLIVNAHIRIFISWLLVLQFIGVVEIGALEPNTSMLSCKV